MVTNTLLPTHSTDTHSSALSLQYADSLSQKAAIAAARAAGAKN